MKRENIFLVIAIVVVLALVSCSGKKEVSSGSSEILAEAERSADSGGYDNFTVPPARHTALKNRQWVNDTLATRNTVHWYSFPVTKDEKYYVYWNDNSQGDDTKTADIVVSAYYNNGDIVYCELGGLEPIREEDRGWLVKREITAAITGTIYLAVNPWDNDADSIGTYGIVYTNSENNGNRP